MRTERAVLAVVAARFGFGLAFLAAFAGAIRLPLYLPLSRAWSFEDGPVAMAWFSATALAILVALVAGALGWSLGARVTKSVVVGLARAGALALLLDVAYFTWTATHPTYTPARLDEEPHQRTPSSN